MKKNKGEKLFVETLLNHFPFLSMAVKCESVYHGIPATTYTSLIFERYLSTYYFAPHDISNTNFDESNKFLYINMDKPVDGFLVINMRNKHLEFYKNTIDDTGLYNRFEAVVVRELFKEFQDNKIKFDSLTEKIFHKKFSEEDILALMIE